MRNQDRQQRSQPGNLECQTGNPLGANYSGRTSETASGRTCQAWSASQPHEHTQTYVGEHNYCRNPIGNPQGVYCYTTDPQKRWEYCSVPICTSKILDFSADNDHQPDGNGEYTSATVDAGFLPESFTICLALMVDAWTVEFSSAIMFTVLDDFGHPWGRIDLSAGTTYTQYRVTLGPLLFFKKTDTVFFPLQWTHVCFSQDSDTRKGTLVVDGQLLEEGEYRREDDVRRPANLSLLLGYYHGAGDFECPVKIANLNVFNSALSVERAVGLTRAGEEECGAPGDLVSWEGAEWTLHSQAKFVEVDKEWEGPCRKESKVQVFTADFNEQHDCMEHCKKISYGRSPPVTSEKEWKKLTREVDLITQDRSILPNMWLSATEGDKDKKLARIGNWPQTEVVKNETKRLEAEETVWRDFYTGQRLGNWTKPYSSKGGDGYFGDTSNCMVAYPWHPLWHFSWGEIQCYSYDMSCPCSYPAQPLLRLRGLCSPSIDWIFSPKQLPGNPGNMILLGIYSTRIEYNDTSSLWMLTDAKSGMTAVSKASKISYVLGKHKWTISNDADECNEGKPYTTMLKLTGCKEEGEFTCNDGQCIEMEERCNQVPDCRDKSDEKQCQLIAFEDSYNKDIPPIGRAKNGRPDPVDVSISITLMKVVEIEEVDHSIHLQFQISLQWRENRVKYNNLKKDSALNALTDEEIRTLWLPLILYDNTDQKEVTRLGVDWEWMTLVTVSREGGFARSGIREVDEA